MAHQLNGIGCIAMVMHHTHTTQAPLRHDNAVMCCAVLFKGQQPESVRQQQQREKEINLICRSTFCGGFPYNHTLCIQNEADAAAAAAAAVIVARKTSNSFKKSSAK